MKKIQAFTIIETLITLLAITIMIAGPIGFMYKTYTYANFVKAKVVETELSQEGLELATSLRNYSLVNFKASANSCINGCSVDWNGNSSIPTFTPCTGVGCQLQTLSTDQYPTYKTIGDTPTDFFRYVKFTPIGATGYVVDSITYATVTNVLVQIDLKKTIYNLNTF